MSPAKYNLSLTQQNLIAQNKSNSGKKRGIVKCVHGKKGDSFKFLLRDELGKYCNDYIAKKVNRIFTRARRKVLSPAHKW